MCVMCGSVCGAGVVFVCDVCVCGVGGCLCHQSPHPALINPYVFGILFSDLALQLRQRISMFATQVQSRRRLLDLSVLFQTHYREVI